MMIGELYQHKQQQNLQAFLLANQSTTTCFLSEDRPQAGLNQSMASTQQDSILLEGRPDGATAHQENPGVEPTKGDNCGSQSMQADAETTLLEMQRKYYFGGDAGAG